MSGVDNVVRLMVAIFASVVIATLVALFLLGLYGCTPKSAQVATESAFYQAELVACVDSAKTKQESQECREAVTYRYRLAHGLPLLDAGLKDGGAHD